MHPKQLLPLVEEQFLVQLEEPIISPEVLLLVMIWA
jgi:hypothetical protein